MWRFCSLQLLQWVFPSLFYSSGPVSGMHPNFTSSWMLYRYENKVHAGTALLKQHICFGRPVPLCAATLGWPDELTACPQAPHETATDLANVGGCPPVHTPRALKTQSQRTHAHHGPPARIWLRPRMHNLVWFNNLVYLSALPVLPYPSATSAPQPLTSCPRPGPLFAVFLFQSEVSLPARAWIPSVALSLQATVTGTGKDVST